MSTIHDGSVEWQKDFMMGLRKLPLVVGYNKKQTFTSSGTFTPTMTGLYKITLQGGGGGGSGAGNQGGAGNNSGSGGGQGGHGEFYENLTAGTSYSFVIGAGGAGGAGGSASDGVNGGDSTITINSNIYYARGGERADGYENMWRPGIGGNFEKNSVVLSRGCSGTVGKSGSIALAGGAGGGIGGDAKWSNGAFGGGGAGGGFSYESTSEPGTTGGNGYITFEWFDPSEAFPDVWNVLEPSE